MKKFDAIIIGSGQARIFAHPNAVMMRSEDAKRLGIRTITGSVQLLKS